MSNRNSRRTTLSPMLLPALACGVFLSLSARADAPSQTQRDAPVFVLAQAQPVPAPAPAAAPDPAPVTVDISMTEHAPMMRAWYMQPWSVAAGVVVLMAFLIVMALALRSGGTGGATIVKS